MITARKVFATVLVCAATFVAWAQAQSSATATVAIDGGTVRGLMTGRVIAWKGIPYAAPPVGSLRWRNPQPVHAWAGVKDATRFGPACLQPDAVAKSEDCLTLNVWRPVRADTGPLPVMVWMHGGAMVHGSSAIYPLDAMAAQDIVMVSMNFRLGRLGYFAHPALATEAPEDVRGNYGFMDQLAALQWIQRNIGRFGGDPNQVTIFGESAGAGSVLAHLVSPLSRGLFHRALLQSPGSPGPRNRAIPSTDLAAAEKIAEDWTRSLGITGDAASVLRQLRALAPDKLLAGVGGQETLALLAAGRTPSGMAMAIVDGRFLVEPPEASLAAGRWTKVPILAGANDRDLPIGTAVNKDDVFTNFGPDAGFARALYDPRGDQTLDELKQQVFADRTMLEPVRHLANEAARAEQPVWLYRFAYVSEAQRGENMGTLHGFEIPFAMNVPGALVADKATRTDALMGDLVSGYWVSFAMTGDPNGGNRPVWPKYVPTIDRLMHFTNSGAIVGTDPLRPRLDLWQHVWSRN